MIPRRTFIAQCLMGVAFTSSNAMAQMFYDCGGTMSSVRLKISGGYTVTFTVGVTRPYNLYISKQSITSTGAELYIPEQGVGYSGQRRGGSFEFELKGKKSGRQDVSVVRKVESGSDDLILNEGAQRICGLRVMVERSRAGVLSGGMHYNEKLKITLTEIT